MLIIILLLYFILCFAVPTFRTYKKTGLNPITFSKSQSAHDLIGLYMKILILLNLIGGIESINLPGLHLELLYINTSLKMFGIVLIMVSIVWTVVAQIQMADSWRIGIDEKNKTHLRTNGLFRFSRNPIFLGMLVFQTGVFFYHPTSLFLFILSMSFILITIQVRLEENFLSGLHGETYKEFQKSVPRWIFLRS